jgi:hypothetical protein
MKMFGLFLRFFGYAKVPREAVMLVSQARMMWEVDPRHPMVGRSLASLGELLRSTQ